MGRSGRCAASRLIYEAEQSEAGRFRERSGHRTWRESHRLSGRLAVQRDERREPWYGWLSATRVTLGVGGKT